MSTSMGNAVSRACTNCGATFTPNRSHQKFCKPECRQEHHRSHPAVDGAQATVAALRVLKSGKVAAVVHFDPAERERALHLTPGQAVSVLPHD